VEPTTTDPDPGLTEATLTVRGTVTEGVERGCRILVADDGRQFLLLGGDGESFAAGERVEVRGELRVGVMTICQQGVPLSVLSVRRVE
jgi:hypothetical protein